MLELGHLCSLRRVSMRSVLLVLCAAYPAALSADDTARRSAVALTQGKVTFSVGEVEDALAHVPAFQLRAFGNTESEVRHAFVERQFITDLLLARGAEKNAAGSDAWVTLKVKQAAANAARRSALVGEITQEAVDAYYAEHKDEFVREERILVWRILMASREEAVTLLKSLKAAGTVKAFTEAARDKSLDKASYLRSGNLGFLLPDGASAEAKLKMDPALVKAAHAVKDGEFVADVVAEGEAFAIVWRRGSTPRSETSLAQATPVIREKLAAVHHEKAERALIERLRKERLTSLDAAGLGAFEVDIGTGSIFVKK
jgi:peptidyl-prolyl cis-trans isomerase C